MLRHSIFVFIAGWVLWFAIDKHPAALGAIVPAEPRDLLGTFQLAFDMATAGYWKAAFVFLWKAHYIILSLIAGLASSIIFRGVADALRKRRLREGARPEIRASSKDNGDE